MTSTFFSDNTNYPQAHIQRADKALQELIKIALEEDGKDLSAEGVFEHTHISKAKIITKEDSFIVGLPLIPMIFDQLFQMSSVYSPTSTSKDYEIINHVEEGSFQKSGTVFCSIQAPTIAILKAERVILNFITHISGVANLTHKYLQELEGTGVRLLDTRKTLPALRYLEKYATKCAGATNHRLALDDMIMLKDNHIDALGSITKAIEHVRTKYNPCPPIEVECRTHEDVLEAVRLHPERIMLDNFPINQLAKTLSCIPASIEAEISGNISLANIKETALAANERKADFISVGKITHSAPTADFSLKTLIS